jgi:hypothetical protein
MLKPNAPAEFRREVWIFIFDFVAAGQDFPKPNNYSSLTAVMSIQTMVISTHEALMAILPL